jgi:hypothetical protein
MKRRLFLLTLLVLALSLPTYFLDYRFEPLRCQADVCQEGAGVVWSNGEISTFPPGSRGPDHPQGTMGVFTRKGIPIAIGMIGGLLAPMLLLGGAITVALKKV